MFDTEGTVTVSTDHTSESSWESAVDPAGHQSLVMPTFDEAVASGPHLDPEQDQGSEPAVNQEQEQDPSDANEPLAGGPSLRESLRSSGIDAIEFRVIRSGTPVRRLRLTGSRYTFGSAEGCSIRLNDHGLRPMHAVLIREASRIVIRAYSMPIDVNGTSVTEAELHAGDELRLGAYRFELLDDEEAAAHRSQHTSETARTWRSHVTRPVFNPFDKPSSEGERGGVSSSEDLLWKERLRREIEQWRERQIDCDRREDRCNAREAKLRDRETELWSRAENLYRRESRLQSQESATFELYDELTKHQQELNQVRNAANQRQESFHQREIAFRNQEIEYRRQLDEATSQLAMSQEQAVTATQAVERMREQFDRLNQQIEELSSQHGQIERRESEQRSEQENLIQELEKSRDEAVQGQTESEARRREAEDRLEQLEAQLALLQDDLGSDLVAQQEKLLESERAAKQLREQVQELQQSLSQATEESTRLRADYEEAFASVVQLESMVAQTSQSSDKERETWEAEADDLRSAMERLSEELNKANRDLSELRDANAQLTARLDDMQRQRDEARADADARPTPESFQTLQEELTVTSDQLSQAQADYEQTLQELDEVQRHGQREQEKAAVALAEAMALAEANRVTHHSTLETEAVDSQPETDLVEENLAEPLPPASPSQEFIIEADESGESQSDHDSPWNLDSPETSQVVDEDDSVWGHVESNGPELAGPELAEGEFAESELAEPELAEQNCRGRLGSLRFIMRDARRRIARQHADQRSRQRIRIRIGRSN